jgi:hypothetical protein
MTIDWEFEIDSVIQSTTLYIMVQRGVRSDPVRMREGFGPVRNGPGVRLRTDWTVRSISKIYLKHINLEINGTRYNDWMRILSMRSCKLVRPYIVFPSVILLNNTSLLSLDLSSRYSSFDLKQDSLSTPRQLVSAISTSPAY